MPQFRVTWNLGARQAQVVLKAYNTSHALRIMKLSAPHREEEFHIEQLPDDSHVLK